MNKQRLNELIKKYRENDLSRDEYREFVWLLGEPGVSGELENAIEGFWKEEPRERKEKTERLAPPDNSRKILWRISGIAASLVLVVGLFLYFNPGVDFLGQKEIVYQTGFGERLDIELNDGSHITLNANSTLRWVEDWEKSENRQVTLEGEAFFEVKKQNGIPFTVYTNDVAVEVLGTSFNVDSRKTATKVYLEEGKVNLKLKEVEESLDSKEIDKPSEIIMEPGEQVRYSAKEKKVEKEEGLSMIVAAAWKMDVLNFKNMEFMEVLELLRELYGQSFECTDKDLLKTPMYLGVPYSNWEAVRQALELSLNVTFEKVSARRYVVNRNK